MKLVNPKLTRDEVSSYITTWVCKDCLPDGGEQFVMAVDDLDALPTIDAEPIVRCGECKWLGRSDGRCSVFADTTIRPSVSDFCSYGEREENPK